MLTYNARQSYHWDHAYVITPTDCISGYLIFEGDSVQFAIPTFFIWHTYRQKISRFMWSFNNGDKLADYLCNSTKNLPFNFAVYNKSTNATIFAVNDNLANAKFCVDAYVPIIFLTVKVDFTLDARGFSLLERRNTTKRREKPLVQAFENLTSMHRLIDIEKTSNLMRDITYQSASLVPTVLWCQIQKFNVPYKIWK